MNIKKTILLFTILCTYAVLGISQKVIKKDKELNLYLESKIFTQTQYFTKDHSDPTVREFCLIELIERDEKRQERLLWDLTHLENEIGVCNPIGDFTYNKINGMVYAAIARSYSRFFVIYKIDPDSSFARREKTVSHYEFLSKPLTEENKKYNAILMNDMYRAQNDKQVFSAYDNSLIVGNKLYPKIKLIQEIKISIVENDIHVLINESTDKQKLSYNETDGWKLLEE